jgi:hypothetical protein
LKLFLLIVHGLSATLLLGAITHQAIAVWAPSGSSAGFWRSLRAVHPQRYAQAIVLLLVLTVGLGALIYIPFRSDVRAAYLDASVPWATGLFEVKEHAAALALALLPAYWALWKNPGHAGSRRVVTTFLLVVAWWNFVVGHVINNLRGL